MTTQYYTASSLDGFIATPDDSLEGLVPLGNIADTSYPQFFAQVGALAMGSATYRWMLEHVVKPGSAHGGKRPYGLPAWVLPRMITSPPLKLVSVRQVGMGFAELRYEVARQDNGEESPGSPPSRG